MSKIILCAISWKPSYSEHRLNLTCSETACKVALKSYKNLGGFGGRWYSSVVRGLLSIHEDLDFTLWAQSKKKKLCKFWKAEYHVLNCDWEAWYLWMLFSVPVSYWELQSPPLLIDGGYNKKQMHTEHLLCHRLVTKMRILVLSAPFYRLQVL